MFSRLQCVLRVASDASFAALWWTLALGVQHRVYMVALLVLLLLTWLPYVGLRLHSGPRVSDEPESLGWARFGHDLARRLTLAAGFWGLIWYARAQGLGGAGFWNQAVPMGVGGVLIVSALIGQDNPREANRSRHFLLTLPPLFLGFFAMLPNPWTSARDEVWRGTRKFNRGVFLSCALLLALASVSTTPVVLALGLTVLAVVLPIVHAFATYRKLAQAPLAASAGVGS